MINIFNSNIHELAKEVGELYAEFVNHSTMVHGEILKGSDIKKWALETYHFDYGIRESEEDDHFIALIFTESKSYGKHFISGFIRTKGFHDAQVIDPYDNFQCEFFSLMHATNHGFRRAVQNIEKNNA